MSLSGALNNAASGLAMNARAASLVSNNISNATTPHFGRRSLHVMSNNVTTHGGVQIGQVQRHADPTLLNDRRLSDAQASMAGLLSAHAMDMEHLVGQTMDPSSLAGRVTAFDTALLQAAADPASDVRLNSVAEAAHALTAKVTAVSSGIQTARERAEAEIETQVATLNGGLSRIADLNSKISLMDALNRDSAALQDQRQAEIDQISELVPLRIMARDRGTVALYSVQGQALLDGTPPTFSFQRANVITPDMTLSGGTLSPLRIDGRVLDLSATGQMSGGRLAAAFEIRDAKTILLQADLDAFAFDLATRFGPGGPDQTLLAGDRGLFTDAGQFASNADGLAARLAVHPDVAPGSNTQWKIRDGLNAATPGPAGQSQLISDLRTALGARNGAQPLTVQAAQLASTVAQARIGAESLESYSDAARTSLREQELALGVDTDAELQHLMTIEQNYAANAQVLRTIDDLMQLLLR